MIFFPRFRDRFHVGFHAEYRLYLSFGLFAKFRYSGKKAMVSYGHGRKFVLYCPVDVVLYSYSPVKGAVFAMNMKRNPAHIFAPFSSINIFYHIVGNCQREKICYN